MQTRPAARIHVLPDPLVNQIAAGEVIERPASVVKELVENALDAGAARISIQLEGGGRHRILVEDDGHGLDSDELLLALTRHATSKLASEKDLFQICTLGFRGEALPSIASVCRMTLASRSPETAEGARIKGEAGAFGDPEPCGLPPGTRVEVEDLFFNVPARRKFLRTPATELTHIITMVEHYALASPSTAFQLSHDGRSLLTLPPAEDRRSRFFSLFPEFKEEDFSPVALERPGVVVEGLAGVPERNLASPRYQFTLVNGRFVRDRVIQHAIRQAYENTHPKGRHPLLMLSLQIPPGMVDVNVHPTKREVRFTDSHGVHQAVFHGIRNAVAPGEEQRTATPASIRFPGAPGPNSEIPAISDPGRLFDQRNPSAQDMGRRADSLSGPASSSPLRALAQWRDSFILCDSPEGLAIVDQHVAHERLRFEQFRRFLDHPGPRQPFLTARTYPLPRHVAHRGAEAAELLNSQGFEAEPFGEGVLAVRSAPAFLGNGEIDAILDRFFQEAGELLQLPRNRWKEVLIMRSCRGSVMLHDPLTLEKMQYLLDTLFSMGAPLTCPHGRPIVYTLREADILARFDRKGSLL
ncbi:MAG: DNA mismatch repair endonuclease MutL [Acidobacteriota bacterium]